MGRLWIESYWSVVGKRINPRRPTVKGLEKQRYCIGNKAGSIEKVGKGQGIGAPNYNPSNMGGGKDEKNVVQSQSWQKL
jgi:hypothetical protein